VEALGISQLGHLKLFDRLIQELDQRFSKRYRLRQRYDRQISKFTEPQRVIDGLRVSYLEGLKFCREPILEALLLGPTFPGWDSVEARLSVFTQLVIIQLGK